MKKSVSPEKQRKRNDGKNHTNHGEHREYLYTFVTLTMSLSRTLHGLARAIWSTIERILIFDSGLGNRPTICYYDTIQA